MFYKRNLNEASNMTFEFVKFYYENPFQISVCELRNKFLKEMMTGIFIQVVSINRQLLCAFPIDLS